jgi:glutathionyl-hydroquinone reductase
MSDVFLKNTMIRFKVEKRTRYTCNFQKINNEMENVFDYITNAQVCV